MDQEGLNKLAEKLLEERKAALPANIRGLLEKVHGKDPAKQWDWIDSFEAELNGEGEGE